MELQPKEEQMDPNSYGNKENVCKFEEMSQYMMKKHTTMNEPLMEPTNLSIMTGNIKKYLKDWCGVNSPKPRPFTRIPSEIFNNTSATGPLYKLLLYIIKYKQKKIGM